MWGEEELRIAESIQKAQQEVDNEQKETNCLSLVDETFQLIPYRDRGSRHHNMHLDRFIRKSTR